MNEIGEKSTDALLHYQTLRLQDLIKEIVRCCEDRRLYESQTFGLPYAELNCLMQFEGERYLTVKGIAQKLDVAKSRVTKIITGLTNKGLIEQIPDPRDARIKLISLTPEGKRKSEEIHTFIKDIHRQILLHIDLEERKNVLSYLQLLRSTMEAVKGKMNG